LKSNGQVHSLIYVHKNVEQQFVMSYGIGFKEFAHYIPEPLQNMLLIKHQFDYGAFNMHTNLEYVEENELKKIVEDNVYGYGDFCWIDFQEEVGVNELNGQEIAELLYLGHLKQHLCSPFYSKLNNRFVYLSHDDGWFNKIYYRDFNDFYHMLGSTVSSKLSAVKGEKTLLGIKKRKEYPPIPKDVIYSFREKMKEGMVIAVEQAIQSRGKIEIPIWVIGDYFNMDEMYEDYVQMKKMPANGLIVYDRKSKEWNAIVK
jgi:hypothetical protein